MTAYQFWAGIGTALGWIGWALSPLLLLPLLGLVLPRLLAVPLGVLSRAADTVNMAVGWTSKWVAVCLVGLVSVIVVERYVFGLGSTKMQEGVLYLHAMLFMLAAGSTLLKEGHVRVDVFYATMSPRRRAITDLAGTYLFLIPLCILVLYEARPYVAASWRVWEGSRENQGLPFVYLLKTLIPIFAVLLVIQAFSLAAKCSLLLTGRGPAPAEPQTAENVVI